MRKLLLVSSLLLFALSSHAQTSLWSNSVTPVNTGNCADSSTELGLRFQSNVAGQITAIRFYKGSQNTGTHVGRLWTASGTLLASVTFTNETSSGWQQQSLVSPVTIAANTVYVVSYTSPNGFYALDASYFTNSAYSNGPLMALESGVNGGGGSVKVGNGVYSRPGGTFPNENSTSNSNSYVDVVFVQASSGVSVNLAWTAVSGASSYKVYRSTISGSGYTNIASVSGGLTYTDTSVNHGTTYYYVVTSISGSVESPKSTQLAATP